MDFEIVARLADGERRWAVREGRCSIGRGPHNDVVIDQSTVSFHHAWLHRHGDRIEIENRQSTNGVLINSLPVADRHPIRPGDEVNLGGVRLRLVTAGIAHSTSTPAAHAVTWQDLHALTPPPHKITRFLDTLVNVGSYLVGRHTREEIYDIVLTHMADLVDYQLGCLFLWNGWELEEVRRRSRGAVDQELAFSQTVRERAALNHTPLLVSDPIDPTESMRAGTHPIGARGSAHGQHAGHRPALPGHSVLGPAIDLDDVRLVALLASTLALKISSCDYAEELERARCVQRSLLAHLPPAPPATPCTRIWKPVQPWGAISTTSWRCPTDATGSCSAMWWDMA